MQPIKQPAREKIEIPNYLSPLRIGFLYLLIPFLIFSLGFIKPVFSIPMALVLTWTAAKYWIDRKEDANLVFQSKQDLIIGCGLLMLWVALSGIGGFAFQNPDFHGRNAIFRDLVTKPWPVIYTQGGENASSSYGFTYYIGFWLPSALAGKLLGWQTANIALFVWSLTGVFITAALLMKQTKLGLIQTSLLLIFFSGMDIAGVLALQGIQPGAYPGIWPPNQHLEWWAPGMQYSSFTTQLFWVFNQAIPAWVALLLTINLPSKKSLFLILALCIFLSPIPATGLLPITVLTALANRKGQGKRHHPASEGGVDRFRRAVPGAMKELVTTENALGGGLILMTSLLFFYSSSSSVPREINAIHIGDVGRYLLFASCEWFILWLVLFKHCRKKPLFYLAGAFLLAAPAIMLSGSDVIAKRATIPMLFLLMAWSGEYLARGRGRRHSLLIILLLLGSLTPIYEINRSIYRTAAYHFQGRKSPAATESIYPPNADKPPFPDKPEADHPWRLVADEWYTLSVFNPASLGSWIGPTTESVFYRFFARP